MCDDYHYVCKGYGSDGYGMLCINEICTEMGNYLNPMVINSYSK